MASINDVTEFDKLTDTQKSALLTWIGGDLRHAPCGRLSSYYLKHEFEAAPAGFYLSNGAFKGAMTALGVPVASRGEPNWGFRVARPDTPCRARQAPLRDWLAASSSRAALAGAVVFCVDWIARVSTPSLRLTSAGWRRRLLGEE